MTILYLFAYTIVVNICLSRKYYLEMPIAELGLGSWHPEPGNRPIAAIVSTYYFCGIACYL
jgi:hypothetical protein